MRVDDIVNALRGRLLLEFYVYRDKLYLFIIEPEGEVMLKDMKGNVKDVNKGLRDFYESVFSKDLNKRRDLAKPLSSLGNILLDPLVDVIENRDVVLVPDSMLFYVPFNALVSSEEKYFVDYVNSLTLAISASSIPLLSRLEVRGRAR